MCGHSCTSEKFGWQAAISKDLLSVQQAIFNVTWQEKNCLQQLWPSALGADSRYARICVALLAEDEEARDVHHKVFAS